MSLNFEKRQECNYFNLFFSNYEVGDQGNVYSKLTGKRIKPYIDGNGYSVVKLYHTPSKRYTLFVHRLVLSAFKPALALASSDLQVDHIHAPAVSRVAKNNALSNLRFVTPSQNLLNRQRRKSQPQTTCPFLWKHEAYIEESLFFQRQFGSHIRVTTLGRVWWKRDGRFTEGTTHKAKYKRIALSKKNLYVHRLVWMAKHGPVPPRMVICHDDFSPSAKHNGVYTNFLTTLRCDTQSANAKEYVSAKRARLLLAS